jgi:hypothetical protein
MADQEKQAWGSLVAAVLVWAFLVMRMTDGGRLVAVDARHMLYTYVAVVVLMAVTHAVLAAVLAAPRRRGTSRDERDDAIEARAERIEGWVVAVAINALVIHVLAEAAFPRHALPRVDLAAASTLVFLLLSALFAGHLAKQVAMIWMYRR